MLWNLWDIVYPSHNMDYISWTLSLFGLAAGFSDTYTLILLPMTVADKNRYYAYELTMIGTIIALVNFVMYFVASFISSIVIKVAQTNLDLGNIFNRCLIIFCLFLSTWVWWHRAMRQLRQVQRTHRRRRAST